MPPIQAQLSPAPLEEEGVPDDDELVSISRRDLEELKAKAASAPPPPSEPPLAGIVSESKVDRTSHGLADFGETERTRQDERSAERERTYRSALLERELVTALAGKTLVPGAIPQLVKLWREDFDVYEDDGSIKIASHNGRTVAEIVNDRLSDPAYSHFQLAKARGGTGSQGVGHATGTSTPIGPKSLGDSILQQWRDANSQSRPQGGRPGWGRPR